MTITDPDRRPTMSSTAPVALELRGVSVAYGKSPAVNDVTLRLAKGSFLVLVGRNGSGRSSLLKAIAGATPYTGSVLAGGVPMRNRRPTPALARRHGVALVPERHVAIQQLTVGENLRIAQGWAGNRATSLDEVFELFPILHTRRDVEAGLISGGEHKMLGIALALVADPNVLLIDEPGLGLAPIVTKTVHDALAKVASSDRVVVVSDERVSSHLASVCTHIGGMKSGRLVDIWDPRDPTLEQALHRVIFE